MERIFNVYRASENYYTCGEKDEAPKGEWVGVLHIEAKCTTPETADWLFNQRSAQRIESREKLISRIVAAAYERENAECVVEEIKRELEAAGYGDEDD